MNPQATRWVLGVCLVLGAGGCRIDWESRSSRVPEDERMLEDEPPPPPPPATPPPRITWVDVPDWPPLGRDSTVTVAADSTAPLSSLEYTFRNHLVRSPSETSVTGLELGEGFGALTIRATDVRGGFASQEVKDLLVDLTPPEITLTATVVPADGRIELWVADAWILGRVELELGGTRRSHQFEIGYPSTLGEAWDVSLVEFYAEDFPEGASIARVTAVDASGNEVVEEFDLAIDGTPPRVAFTEPSAGAIASQEFLVALEANDAGDRPVAIELFAGGAFVATVLGPTAEILLDARDFPPGPLDLTAVAIDEAGNESRKATVGIEVAPAL